MTPKGKINNASEGASGVRVGEKEKGKARSRNLLYRRKSGNLRLKMVFNNNKKKNYNLHRYTKNLEEPKQS